MMLDDPPPPASHMDAAPGVAHPGGHSPPRPQSLMLNFLGIYALGRPRAIYSGSFIEVFRRVGVSEEAVRSTLSRMVARGLLSRHRRGRRVYLGLTPRATGVLQDGLRRVWETGAVNHDWDGTWTLVGFSLPDTRRSERHELRSQLTWAGFGLLQHGLWVAPGAKDVVPIVETLGLSDHVTVLAARVREPTTVSRIVTVAFDVGSIAGRYRAFLDRWSTPPLPGEGDDLARQLLVHTDWLQLVRQDPHLPAEHLPEGWPAIEAELLFHRLSGEVRPTAAAIATELLQEISLEEGEVAHADSE